MNMTEATNVGVGDLVDVTLCNFNDGLPDDWTGVFTHVVSCEVLCHAASKLPDLFLEVKRV
jgi:hypothetical protein